MKRKLRLSVVFVASILIAWLAIGLKSSLADETSWQDAYEYIGTDTVWHKTDNLVFDKPVLIDANATLTIEAGSSVRLNGGELTVNYGNIVAEGAQNDPIEFSSDNGAPFTIVFVDYEDGYEGNIGKTSLLRYVRVVGGGSYVDPEDCGTTGYRKPFLIDTAYAAGECAYGTVAMRYISGRVDIDHASFIGNHYADMLVDGEFSEYNRSDFLNISNTNFGDNTQGKAVLSQAYCSEAISHDECASKVVMRNNWWGDASGPYFESSAFELPNTDGTGNRIVGDGTLVFSPWATLRFEDTPAVVCTENCFSNVLFLPGIKASRLYKDDASGDADQLWLPNYFGNDLSELSLDENGKSVEDVYTKDVLDEAGIPWAGTNIYKTFLAKLDAMKADHTINDYQSFAYDWRQNVEDIAREGTPYPQSVTRSLTADLDTLAQSSKSGKVIIVAHSNGGLLAKALMLELQASGQADKVDKIVFVGTPQMGTPLSILSLLYGYDESLLAGTLISHKDARVLAENMPGVYGLLPSETYFDRMEDAFVKFSSERTRYKRFKDAYGEALDSFDELKAFLSGSGDGRVKPAASDVESENVLNARLLDQAQETQRRLDAWVPTANIEVIQIAGWGLDTVSGVEYTEKEKTSCHASPSGGQVPSCTGIGEYEPVYDPKFTVDGDEVVTAPSALMLSDAPNVRRYWVDLHDYNDVSVVNRGHKDILEVDSLEQFLSDIIHKQSLNDLPEFIKTTRPSDYDDAKPRLRMSLYSPLDIHLYDSAGRHTGPKKITVDGKEETIIEIAIPNSYYYLFGERKYVGFGGDEPIRVEMDGYGTGSYTLKLEEVKPTVTGEETLAYTTFENLPVTPETKVTLAVPTTGLSDLAPLEADIDGDGTKDYAVTPVPNGTATLDTIAPEAKIGFDPVTQKLSIIGTDNVSTHVPVTITETVVPKKSTNSMKFDRERNDAERNGNGEKTRITATLTDEAGHVTIVTLLRDKDKERRMRYALESVSYDGSITNFSETSLHYKWRLQSRKNTYTMLASRLKSGSIGIESHYRPKKNVTVIMRTPQELDDRDEEDESDRRAVRETLPGMVVPYLVTDQGHVTIGYDK